MSKLLLSVRIPPAYDRQTWADILRQVERQVNSLSEGALAGHYSAYTSQPTTGTHATGDFIRNSAPTVLGTAPDQYIVYGWICTLDGTPGTWQTCRFLVSHNVVVTSKATITFTGLTPVVRIASFVAPTKGSIVFAGKTPTLVRGTVRAPTKGSIVFTGKAPTVV